MHKTEQDPPLRPIISQIGTPTYEMAKNLNDILCPYMTTNHVIQSTLKFTGIARSFDNNGYLASLGMESLFTNVSVDNTIAIILDCAYIRPTANPPNITK